MGKRKRKRIDTTGLAAPRKRRRQFIVERSCDTLRRRDPDKVSLKALRSRSRPPMLVKIGDTLDIFPLLGDFLISNCNLNLNNNDARLHRLRPHREVMVRPDAIRGKTLLIYMLSLRVYHIPGGLSRQTHSLIASLKERVFYYDVELEVVFVPVDRGPDFLHNCAINRFNEFLAEMPWLAVPFSNKRACDLIHDTFFPLPWHDIDPCWALIEPSGRVLLTSDYVGSFIFNDYGIGELVPHLHKMLPSLVDAQGNSKDFDPTQLTLFKLLRNDDKAFVQGIINFNKLLGAPFPDFLLTNNGNKVSVSILEGKVVGLYLCNHAATGPSRIESVKKIYNETARLGYDFEIVQIDFNYSGYFRGNVSCPENVPWLTLPYIPSRCKRLIRVFERNIEPGCRGTGFIPRERDGLVIINPHKSNMREDYFFEKNGMDIMCRFGVEAYPFTRSRVYDMLTERRAEEIKLRLIFGHNPLLRCLNNGSYEQVPVSQLWGRRVMVIFATHSKYKPCKFLTDLKSKYLEQKGGGDAFEVVYISYDANASTFDDFTAYMPWLVHPYSWEFAREWVTKTCVYYDYSYSDSSDSSDSDKENADSDKESDDSDSDEDSDIKTGAWCGMVSFGEDGEFISRKEFNGYWSLPRTEYPFFVPSFIKQRFLLDLQIKYGIELSRQW